MPDTQGLESTKRSGVFNFTYEGKKYGLKYGSNEVALAQEKIGRTAMEMQVGMATGDMVVIRALFWAGIHGWHRRTKRPGNPPSLIESGDMMDAVGLKPAIELVSEAFKAAFPTDPEQEAVEEEETDEGEPEPAPS